MINHIYRLLMLLSLVSNVKAGDGTVDLDRNAIQSVQVEDASWSMAGANPERTSWTAEEVPGELQPLWHKPFEPYISQKVQIIAAYNTLYISTAKGLYALDAESGAQRWVYPTALPLGHSPTVQNGIAYVGGMDHKLHAVDAFSGQGLWSFEAGAGFQTNPLVVAGKVYMGNRDGFFYAIHAQGPQGGQLAWKYATQGPILFSAAYKDGLVYFASQDSHAYALDAESGTLVWKSTKLPGAGFQSFWPVVYRDRVIFAGSRNYPSTSRLLAGGKDTALETQDIYPNRHLDPDGTLVGPVGQEPGDWAPGTLTLDTSRPNVTANGQTTPITEYFEQKPWRRTVFVLDRQTGQEVTYDFDQDGQPEYAPFLWFGTHSGNRYPPVVGGDGVLYLSNNFQSSPAIPWGHITGWKMDSPFISLPAPGRNAVDEPQGYVAGGDLLHWNRCCDRVGAAFDLRQPGTAWTYFSYNLVRLLPGYNNRYFNPDPVDYTHVFAAFGGSNGVYGFHADTNPPIPYQGKVYMHRSNAVIAFGTSSSAPMALPLAETVEAPPAGLTPLGPEALKVRLAEEIQNMLAAGHLRPGYASHGHFDLPAQHQCGDDLVDYFHHPADTVVTLVQALPHLPESMQPQVKAYLQNEFASYPPHRYNHIGWRDGAAREAFDLPPEVSEALVDLPPEVGTTGFVWGFNPYSLYALWQYAILQNNPTLTQQLFVEAQNNRALMDSLLNIPPNVVLARMPMVHNAYIAGYLGYLGLEQLAGQSENLPMRQALERLLQLRASQFSKDSAYANTFTREDGAYCRTMNVASNFMFLVPELGQYLREHALTNIQAALTEYESLAPYWFVSFAEEGFGENALVPLYDSQTLFLAKAWILEEPGTELEKFLDVPAFARGDLFYIQKLVAAIENYQHMETSIHIDEQEMQGSPFWLAPGAGIRKSFPGINAGPVKIEGSANILAAERIIYKSAGGVDTSFSEMMGLPANQLDTIYWLPWYNNEDLDTQLRFANVTGSTATVHVFIGGNEMQGSPFTLQAGESTRKSFPGINGGPVKLVSDHGVPIVAAERLIYKFHGIPTSFSEMMALPDSQLDTTFWLPWYNNVSLDTQLRFANTTNQPASVHVFIGGNEMQGSPFTLQAGESTRKSFAGIDGGPVKIVSDHGVPIVAAERLIYKVNGLNTSFSEMMALPNSQLDTAYSLPWYNNKDLDTQLRFANTTNTTATVHVFIGGAEMIGSPFTLLAGESTRQSFINVDSGPVQIVSDVPIIAAEQVIYKFHNINTSFSEMMALPHSQLDTTYWFPWYNNSDLDTQLRFGTP